MFSRHEKRLAYTAAACVLVNLVTIVFAVFGVYEATVRAERWRVEVARLREELLERVDPAELDENDSLTGRMNDKLSFSAMRIRDKMGRGIYGNYLKPIVTALWLVPVACIPFVLAYRKKYKTTVRWGVFVGLSATVAMISLLTLNAVLYLGHIRYTHWLD